MQEEIRSAFGAFGQIEKVKMLPDKKCAFVNFMTQDEATRARQGMQGKMLGGQMLRIKFGKDTTPAGSGGMRKNLGGGDYDSP